ncbi:unnamed protein product [Eretmochelys imbricata]
MSCSSCRLGTALGNAFKEGEGGERLSFLKLQNTKGWGKLEGFNTLEPVFCCVEIGFCLFVCFLLISSLYCSLSKYAITQSVLRRGEAAPRKELTVGKEERRRKEGTSLERSRNTKYSSSGKQQEIVLRSLFKMDSLYIGENKRCGLFFFLEPNSTMVTCLE